VPNFGRQELLPSNFTKVVTTNDLSSFPDITAVLTQAQAIDQIFLSTNDVVDHALTLHYISSVHGSARLAYFTLPAGAGSTILYPTFELLATLLNFGNGITLEPGDSLKLFSDDVLDTDMQIAITTFGGTI